MATHTRAVHTQKLQAAPQALNATIIHAHSYKLRTTVAGGIGVKPWDRDHQILHCWVVKYYYSLFYTGSMFESGLFSRKGEELAQNLDVNSSK